MVRRVWLALLEKNITFEFRLVDLKAREQLQPDYSAIHPFHHVLTIVDQALRRIESLAILEYLEAKVCRPDTITHRARHDLAYRNGAVVVANELIPKSPQLVLLANQDTVRDQDILRHTETVFTFLEEQLGDAAYFGGDRLSLAGITVGAALHLLRRLGINLQAHPTLVQWCELVSNRSVWQQTEASASVSKPGNTGLSL